ncbi:hypothetical protein NBRC116494_24630 [Aurantivibrio plasticivorans]
MQLSSFVFYAIVEAIVFLLIVAGFLYVFLKRAQSQNKALEDKNQRLIDEYKALHAKILEEREEHNATNTYKKQINDQILATRQYHKKLGATSDITLDLNPESPVQQRTAAIRHAILIAEKEALNASVDGSPNWQFLEAKFQQIIQFFVDLAPKPEPSTTPPEPPAEESADTQLIEELEAKLSMIEEILEDKHQEIDELTLAKTTLDKRVENLEKFKTLFFEMEDQWKAAKEEAQKYYEQLSAMRDEVSDTETFDDLLTRYHAVYNEVESTIQSIQGIDTPSTQPPSANNLTPDNVSVNLPTNNTNEAQILLDSDQRALDELSKLRTLTTDQHRLIAQLQTKLKDADTIEQKEAIIGELEKELQKQSNFVRESEMCIQLMEDELQRVTSESKRLAQLLNEANSELSQVPQMQTTIRQFSVESKELIAQLADLEKVNTELQQEFDSLKANSATAPAPAGEGTNELKAELQSLQAKYAELEERYLEARMK